MTVRATHAVCFTPNYLDHLHVQAVGASRSTGARTLPFTSPSSLAGLPQQPPGTPRGPCRRTSTTSGATFTLCELIFNSSVPTCSFDPPDYQVFGGRPGSRLLRETVLSAVGLVPRLPSSRRA